MKQASQVNFHIPANAAGSLGLTPQQVTADSLAEFKQKLGIDFGMLVPMGHAVANGLDALQPLVTTASVPTPVQFLQNWLPGYVNVITAARKIDTLIGITNVGAWEDEQVVLSLLEHTGLARPYGDKTNAAASSWNLNFETRTVLRFEEGIEVGALESARAGRVNIDSAKEKRAAAMLALNIARNSVGFYGYNDGANKTYGFLNDPNLLAYNPVEANQAGETQWAKKDYLDIVSDILTAVAELRSQSGDTIDAFTQKTMLAVASDSVSYLAKVSQYGNSVMDWVQKTFNGNMRIESAPELNAAVGGENVFYLYPERVVEDGSTDGNGVWVQPVPALFKTLGVQALTKGFKEDYSNATAGAFLKRGYAVWRGSGI